MFLTIVFELPSNSSRVILKLGEPPSEPSDDKRIFDETNIYLVRTMDRRAMDLTKEKFLSHLSTDRCVPSEL